jgi:hypothetical protein
MIFLIFIYTTYILGNGLQSRKEIRKSVKNTLLESNIYIKKQKNNV